MKLSRRPALLLLLALLFPIIAVGCGKQEINHLGLVMAVGLDKTPKGEYLVTAQIVRPADARGQSGAPSGGTGEPVWTASGEGKSIFEAIRKLGRYSSRRVYWAHNKIIVIGEELARESITDTLDFFTRNHELRMNTWIVVSEGKASELVATKTGLEVIPGDSLDRLFRFSDIISEAPRSTIKLVTAAYLSRNSNPVIAYMQKVKRVIPAEQPAEHGTTEQIELAGAAVFRKEKMVGLLTPEESRALLWFIEKPKSSIYSLVCPDEPDTPASIELRHHNLDIEPSFAQDRLRFNVRLNAKFDLVELGCPTPMNMEKVMRSLELDAEAQIKSEMERMVRKAQKVHRVDYLELSKTFQNSYPGIWKSIHPRWNDYFPEADIRITVKAEIISPVLLKLPTRPMEPILKEGG